MPSATEPRPTKPDRVTEEQLLTALPRPSMKREVRVGLFVIIGVVAFFVALFMMTDPGTFRGRYYVHTVVEDAGGMRRGDPVQMRGVNIGRVMEFEMVPEGVVVQLEIYGEYEIPEDSHAEMESAGLLGGMIVNIIPGQSEERIDNRALIPGTSGVDFFDQAEGLGNEVEAVLGRVNALLAPRTVDAVGESAIELQALLDELNALVARQQTELAATTASLRRAAGGVEGVTTAPELQAAIARLDELTARLNTTSTNLSEASQSLDLVLGRIEQGEGTLGRLSTDEELYTNLNQAAANISQAAENLDALVTDFQANPRKYINVRVF